MTGVGLLQRGGAPQQQHDQFEKRVVTTGLANPFQLVWGPDDHLWVTERTAGRITRVRLADGAKTTAVTIADVLQHDGPGGLLGMALDPGLLKGAGNDFVYAASPTTPIPIRKEIEPRTKIVRFTYDRERFTLGSPKDILANLAIRN